MTVLMLVGLLLVLPLLAQEDLTQVVDLGKGYAISVPEDWEVTEEGYASFALERDELYIYVMTPPFLRREGFTATAEDDLADTLVDMLTAFYGIVRDGSEMEVTQYDGRSAAHYTVYTPYEGLVVLLAMSDGRLGLLHITANEVGLEDYTAQIEAIIATFDSRCPKAKTATRVCSFGPISKMRG